MKKFILFLIILTSSCSFNDLTSEVGNIKKPRFESSKPSIYGKQNNLPATNKPQSNSQNQKSIVNQTNGTENFIDSNGKNIVEDKDFSEQDLPELKPQTAKNFETNTLVIPPSLQRKIQIALFLPLTGKNKELGWSIYNASILSLFDNDLNNKIELVLFDSKESAEDNQKSFKEIIDRNIKIVVGPIFTNSVLAIEKLARDNEITVISLSNNHELLNKTNNHGGIFVGGIIPETQIDKIINYSMDRGKFNFAIIAPNNQYGKIITEYTKKFVRSRDGNFITSEFYENNSKDIERAVERVIGSFGLPTASKNRDTSYLSDYDRIYPQVILIPEAGKTLSKIANSIARLNKDERNFQLIGSSQWNDPSSLNDINLFGGWFPAPQEQRFKIFEKNYYRSFDKFPPRITSIAYDSILAISKIAENKSNLKIGFNDFLEYTDSSTNGFDGIDGVFRFLPNGAIQRNLAILQIDNGGFETLESSIPKFIKY